MLQLYILGESSELQEKSKNPQYLNILDYDIKMKEEYDIDFFQYHTRKNEYICGNAEKGSL